MDEKKRVIFDPFKMAAGLLAVAIIGALAGAGAAVAALVYRVLTGAC